MEMGAKECGNYGSSLSWGEMYQSPSSGKLPFPSSRNLPMADRGNPPAKKKDSDDGGDKVPSVASSSSSAATAAGASGWEVDRESFRLALYIAMAHAGLALLLLFLYGAWKLLQDYKTPILWATLLSMPLREVQDSVVSFWEPPLQKGLAETALALPIAAARAFIAAVSDLGCLLLTLFRKKGGDGDGVSRRKSGGFAVLVQRLVAFGVLTLGCEFLGPATLTVSTLIAFSLYYLAVWLGLIAAESEKQIARGVRTRGWLLWLLSPFAYLFKAVNSRLTRGLVGNRLKSLVAIGLIAAMIVGSIAGLIFFSYSVAVEGKDAVIALKIHVEKSNYAERLGLKALLEEYKVPELIDTYTNQAYNTVLQQIDALAIQYNMTEVADAAKVYLPQLPRRKTSTLTTIGDNTTTDDASYTLLPPPPSHPVFEKLQNVRVKLREYDAQGVYSELEQVAYILLELLQMSKEDALGKAKEIGQKSFDVGKTIAASGTSVFTRSSYFLFSIASSVASSAAGLINFIAQTAVFFSLLYYLVTSESGGVMEQVLGMVPLTEATRKRCASVIDLTVSSVLLATAKTSIFCASFTWLLFRFFQIHFLYMSTLLAFMYGLLPFVIPSWLSSIPAGAQLALEGHYLLAVLLMAAHIWILEYGKVAVQEGIPGHNEYLTALSVAGGMTIFNPPLEGAILGPLIMTVLIALKSLYAEFLLNPKKID